MQQSSLSTLFTQPACTKFTPKLHLFHQLQSNKDDFEIVFLSMDRNEDEYNAYSDKMPWWCLPYAMSTLPQLAVRYQAHALPHLVVLDRDESVLTKEGVQRLSQDPVGRNFPWRPQRLVDLMPSRYLVARKANETNAPRHLKPTLQLDDKYLLLYFASYSDAQSKEFTPWLIKAYKLLRKNRSDFELMFISGDESQASFDASVSDMGFASVPFEDTAAREGLERRLEIQSYPTLVMLGPKPPSVDDDGGTNVGGDRPIINTEVQAVIENGDYVSQFPFYPRKWGDLCTTTDDINTHKCLVVFHEGGNDEEQMDLEDTIQDAADEYVGDELCKFYWACDADAPLSVNIRRACRLGPIDGIPRMVLLDIPNDGAFYVSGETEISAETIGKFLSNYKKHPRGQI